ncbi:DUF58 domain-containing protein [Limisphaera ngatamarikiensis]|uniref:DUF58 domain-containing protein n=1 Tax=Limisphaera ngatamarikiensis TaxID=1324935 RepID=A0A6M1RWR9_9BACT|nr:DUF58 domain-containing protein [Limisphaera ngatamarikiensis]NGO39901.1 DUF58 domain-containing protein [Limisphaera ngatamarikiensis]
MIPREILKKIRQIEIRTNRLVTETLAGQYHSVFRGQGMNFEEVREYQPGDEVRAIDWNVTARMNHPFVKRFVEERELTVLLVVDVSGSGWFGSVEPSKRELAAEVASVLAFSALRNNDKVGLVLFSEGVEAFVPPRKGRRHVLRVIREILFYEPRRRGTDLPAALEFVLRVMRRRAIVVLISDFLATEPSGAGPAAVLQPRTMGPMFQLAPLGPDTVSLLRQVNRRHDLVAVQVLDRYEAELPALGRLMLEDVETGELLEIDTGDARRREQFSEQQARRQAELARTFRMAGVDAILLRTDRPYEGELARFFEMREHRRRHGG